MNKSPLSAEFIEQQRQVLLNLQERLSGQKVVHNADETNGNDFGDMSAAVTAAENAMALVSNANQTLREVQAALKKISTGVYGVCEYSGEMIGQERLEAIPWARFTIEAQSAFEKEGRGRSRRFEAGLFEDSMKATEAESDDTAEAE
jgi:RNA polymerase-binding transcription factor DksA